MNTTARIESTGAKNKVHLSKETAELLMQSGKGAWLRERKDLVEAKGKGKLKTWWLEMRGDANTLDSGSSNGDPKEGPKEEEKSLKEDMSSSVPALAKMTGAAGNVDNLDPRKLRLVSWNVEVLSKALKEILARRATCGRDCDSDEVMQQAEKAIRQAGTTPLDELKEVITLPQFEKSMTKQQPDASKAEVGSRAVDQLRAYVRVIASMYRSNPFHVSFSSGVCFGMYWCILAENIADASASIGFFVRRTLSMLVMLLCRSQSCLEGSLHQISKMLSGRRMLLMRECFMVRWLLNIRVLVDPYDTCFAHYFFLSMA